VNGAELLAHAQVDTILVAVGGGRLMAGIAAAAEGSPRSSRSSP
jgi:threonine dehydratase